MNSEDLQKEFKKRIITITSKNKTFSENEKATYSLLIDHPDFIKEVAKIRREMGITSAGFSGAQEAYNWEHSNYKNTKLLWEANTKLVSEFNIKPAFLSETKFFTYSHILAPKTVKKESGRSKAGIVIICTKKDLEFNKYLFRADTIYLEINQNTVFRDINAAWKKIAKFKKENRPFLMPKPQAIARKVWHLTVEGESDKNIAKIINKLFSKQLGYSDIPVYRKRYKDALCKLRPFK